MPGKYLNFWNLIIEYDLGIGAWHLEIARDSKYSKLKDTQDDRRMNNGK